MTSYSQSFTIRFTSRTILVAVMADPEEILRSSRCPVTRTLTCVPPISTTRILLGFCATAVIALSPAAQRIQCVQSRDCYLTAEAQRAQRAQRKPFIVNLCALCVSAAMLVIVFFPQLPEQCYVSSGMLRKPLVLAERFE